MFIQTEETPNPATLKFVPGGPVMGQGTKEFLDQKSAEISFLAEGIFAIQGVKAIFFGEDFISVTKDEPQDWQDLKPLILSVIIDHFSQNIPLFKEGYHPQIGANHASDDDEIVTQIKEIIEHRVRPVVAQDGGDITFSHFEDGIVYLQMRGACAGCPSSTATLKSGIENLLKYYVPEVVEVRSV